MGPESPAGRPYLIPSRGCEAETLRLRPRESLGLRLREDGAEGVSEGAAVPEGAAAVGSGDSEYGG
jgi:hypothetical protein